MDSRQPVTYHRARLLALLFLLDAAFIVTLMGMLGALPAKASAPLPPRRPMTSVYRHTAPTGINPGATALDIAQAMAADPSIILGATFVAEPPITNTANAVADVHLALFPTNGPTYGILTSGGVTNTDQPGIFTSVDLSGGHARGDSDFDVTILRIDLNAPQGVNCLSLDFRFFSEEYPIYVGTAFNDAFIAELDNSTWSTSGSVISAPNNFAFDPEGNVVSINSTGVTQMTPLNGLGTAYDGGLTPGGPPITDTNGAATVALRASTPIIPGNHSLYLSLFDQGDNILDSAVFLDNLALGMVAGNECTPGATQPSEIALRKTVGYEPNDCAATDRIIVPANTNVTYCYEVTNIGTSVFTHHDLVDSALGSILSNFIYELEPGETEHVLQTVNIAQTTFNTATWTAHNPALQVSAVATDTATVCLQWDLNCDGPVNLLDVQLVAGAWNNPAAYQAAYDHDHNGRIDIIDVQRQVIHWSTGEVTARP
jgi:hypothetical protein